MKRIAVLISGSGTNLQALIDAASRGDLPAEIGLVVSNRKEAYGLIRAQQAGIPTVYFPLKPYSERGADRAAYDRDLAQRIRQAGVDVIVLAGWMHILSAAFMAELGDVPVLNLHPALPGAFPGKDAIGRAYAAFLRGEIAHSGCMVHHVIPEVDAGEVIALEVVPILLGDTLEQFEARMHAVEHRLIVEAVRRVI